ncbi:hypothetical protein NDU88_007943 [Pleurodeles waltl]|uniref:Uncharacterized protein n=1 Tax=Pleurodeles waltl TaxID=8319 RepID=A0AAV7U571_PLEWA|nr:hypothetical protein NDU88_007943 [Pleurodeles waltl]
MWRRPPITPDICEQSMLSVVPLGGQAYTHCCSQSFAWLYLVLAGCGAIHHQAQEITVPEPCCPKGELAGFPPIALVEEHLRRSNFQERARGAIAPVPGFALPPRRATGRERPRAGRPVTEDRCPSIGEHVVASAAFLLFSLPGDGERSPRRHV